MKLIPAPRSVALLLAIVVSTLSPVAVTTRVDAAPAAAAVTCRAYTVIGVRGTDDGSRTSVGNTLPKAVDRFTAVKGNGNVTKDYVSYPAKGVSWNQTYLDSMKSGRTALYDKLAWWISRCPRTKFALFGYSQGAHVVGDVVVALPASFRAKIHGVGLIGDPMMNPALASSVTKDSRHGGMFGRRGSWPAGVYVLSVCNKGDQVCASYTTAQSVGYLTGVFGKPKEHTGYTGTTYSPVAGNSGAWFVGDRVGRR